MNVFMKDTVLMKETVQTLGMPRIFVPVLDSSPLLHSRNVYLITLRRRNEHHRKGLALVDSRRARNSTPRLPRRLHIDDIDAGREASHLRSVARA